MTFNIANWAELSAAIVCTFCFFFRKSDLNTLFMPFLWLTLGVEITGKLASSTDLYPFKIGMYNMYIGVQFWFYLYYLYTVQESHRLKKTIFISIVLFSVFYLINLIFIQGIKTYNSYTKSIASILLVSICLVTIWYISFYYKKSSNYYTPALFVISAIVLFYAGNLVNITFYNYMVLRNPAGTVNLYKLVNHNLNVAFYGGFIIGFMREAYKNEDKEF